MAIDQGYEPICEKYGGEEGSKYFAHPPPPIDPPPAPGAAALGPACTRPSSGDASASHSLSSK